MRRDDHDEPPRSASGTGYARRVVEAVERTLDEVGALRVGALSEGEVVELVDAFTAATSRVTAALGRVLIEADRRRVKDRTGARNTATWWASRARVTRARPDA